MLGRIIQTLIVSIVVVSGSTPTPIAPGEVEPPKPQIGEAAHIELPEPVDPRIDAVNNFFHRGKMPLSGYGKIFVEQADKNGIDYRLLPAIAVKESGGGKRYPKSGNNPFGWASAKVKFSSIDEAIIFISAKLGTGKNYAGKNTLKKLQTYNPPSISPDYAPSVIGIMNQIK